MKKIISLTLCLTILLSTFCFSAGAISINSSRAQLNAQFLDGTIGGADYVYYSPLKKNDTKKYPLVVWLHGNASGDVPRQQLQNYGFSNWASDEYQARFANAGGCFLFAPRANSIASSWSLIGTSQLKSLIDRFCDSFKDNIDFSRIYIAGYSVGADMTWQMVLAYPNFFAAAVPCSALSPPTALDVDSLTDTSIWMVNCDIDYYATARTSSIKPVYNRLCTITNRPDGIRLTNFTEAVFANGTKHSSEQREHYTWECVTYDMHMANGTTPYKYATTIDGYGGTVSFNNPETGVISWLSRQVNVVNDNSSSTEISIFARILDILQVLIDIMSLIQNLIPTA